MVNACISNETKTTLLFMPLEWNLGVSSYTPRNKVRGGYTGITLSVRPSVCLSVRLSVDAWLGKMVSCA